MIEERKLAEEGGYESPVWDTIEETHKCYNNNLLEILRELGPNDCLFIATHNADTVELAKKAIVERNIKDERVRFG